jgi:hypothetical protein
MALTINEANSVSEEYYSRMLTQQVYEKSPFFWKLKNQKNVRIDGGVNIRFPIRYANLDKAKAVNAREQVTYEQVETRTAGQLEWSYYTAHGMISWDERVQNSGRSRVINLIGDKSEEMMEDLYNKFVVDLYNTTQQTKVIQGLARIIDTGDTFAGIAVADAAEWAAALEDTTTTELHFYGSAGSLSHAINLATFGPDKPDLIVTSRDLYNKAESLLEPQKRYEDTMMANGGFTSVKFHDIPIVGDYGLDAASAGSGTYLYGIDCKHMEFLFHRDWNFKTTNWTSLIQAGYPEAMVKVCTWAGNLCCKLRKTNFKFTALDYTI